MTTDLHLLASLSLLVLVRHMPVEGWYTGLAVVERPLVALERRDDGVPPLEPLEQLEPRPRQVGLQVQYYTRVHKPLPILDILLLHLNHNPQTRQSWSNLVRLSRSARVDLEE